ncbi:Cation efflux system protein CusC [Trichinella spiralis]|uniref:Cation efflux system protein CusC n=1 Tax=Trichinella spiralis TaxID=6334 RepID=A0ABR3KD60_TRISP
MMQSRRNMNDAGHPSSNTVLITLTVPTFNASDPELWFLRLDLFFQHQHIVDEVDKLHMALTTMPDEAVAEFRDFLSNALNLPDPFTTFKQLCLKRTAQTKDQRILQTPTNEELNDDKPSQLLRRLQRLLGGASDDIVGLLFLSKLPLPIRTAFVPFQDWPLTERAEMADQIAALQPTTTINAVSSGNGSFESRLERLESLFEKFLQCRDQPADATAIQEAVAHRRLIDADGYPQPDQAGALHHRATKISGDQRASITAVSVTEPKSAPHPVRGETTPAHDANGRRVATDF